MARDIVKDLEKYGIKPTKSLQNKKLDSNEVTKLAMKIADSRGYPREMGKVVNPK
jgi:hypothetical protein